MALVSCLPFMWPPSGQYTGVSNSRFGQSMTFDGTADRIAVVTQAMQAGDINKIHFYINALTTGATLEVRIETVGTDGRPSGTLWATNTNGTVAVSSAGAKSVTLTANATVTLGAFFAVVFKYSSGSTPNMSFTKSDTNYRNAAGLFPAVYWDTGTGTWTNLGNAMFHGILEYATVGPVYNPAFIPLTDASSSGTTYNSGTNPDERALRFQVPFKCRVNGCLLPLDNIAAAADFKIFLWDAAGDLETEALAKLSVDGDIAQTTTADGSYWFTFDTAVTLLPNTTYYLGVRAQTANSLTLGHWTPMTITNVLQAMPGGAQCYLGTRNWTAIDPGTVGAWTDNTALVPQTSLIIDQLDDGAGGGGARRPLCY